MVLFTLLNGAKTTASCTRSQDLENERMQCLLLLFVPLSSSWSSNYKIVVRNGSNTDVPSHAIASPASDRDDTPLAAFHLNISFPFWDARYNTAWVSPNGGVHFEAKPPCECCFSGYTLDGNGQ